MTGADHDIRMVAVDMDGTFVHDDHSYDRPRFERLRARMDAAGVRFVVASGTHMERLRNAFDRPEDLAFVADNGAYVIDRGEEVFVAQLADADAARVIDAFEAHGKLAILGSGPERVYITPSIDDEHFEILREVMPSATRVDSLHEVRGKINKFAAFDTGGLSGELDPVLLAALGEVVVPVTSGHLSMDFILPGVHKASGLVRLMDRWGVEPAQLAAFGDSANDIEMLKFAGHGIAMANATPQVKEVADAVVASNNDDGVLEQLSIWFGED